MFNSLKKRSDDRKKYCSVEIRCEEDRNERLQIFLRAGYSKILATGDCEVFRSKFFIDMYLNTKSTENINVTSICDPNDGHNNDALPEEGLITMRKVEHSDPNVNKLNTTMTVNSLQLAILAKQSSVIEYLMDQLFSNSMWKRNKSLNSAYEFLSEKVVLNFNGLQEEQFSPYDRSLNKMNALHLSCRYHSEGIKIIFDAIYKHKAALSCLSNIVNDKENILGYAPLHIAAKKSFVDVAR